MITIAKIEGVLMSARVREFDSKPQEDKPSKHYKFNEYYFYAPSLHITGCLKDWDCFTEITTLNKGDLIMVHFNRCSPMKGMDSFYDFTGYLVKVK